MKFSHRLVWRIIWLVLPVFLVVLPVKGVAQEADIITGRVTDEEGKPVAGARVVAMSIETEITRSTITDANGRYMIHFPDGGGRYILRVSLIGLAESVRPVMRQGDEELLVTNIKLTVQPVALAAVEVNAQRSPSRGQTGERGANLAADLMSRLPLPDLDPNTLALLAAGVVSTSVDSLTGRMGFSVAGMSDLLNQIVMDGTILRNGGLNLPQEGIRHTQVTTNTFDASRGGFAGGQVAMTSTRGTNRVEGALSYQHDSDAFQFTSARTATPFTRHNLGGAFGGPLISNRLFYNVAFGAWRTVSHRFALDADDPAAAVRSGVARDSIARFLSILNNRYSVPTLGGPYGQLTDNLSLQVRTDWHAVQKQGQSHTLGLRLNAGATDYDSTRINALDLSHHGGDAEGDNASAALTLASSVGSNWTNNLNLAYNIGSGRSLPYLESPEARVRVTSDFEGGQRGTEALVFGGNRSMPSDERYRSFQLNDDLSFILPIGSQIHRLKVGGTLQRMHSTDRSAHNLFGSFTYGSLAELEENRPLRYDRTLSPFESRTGSLNGGLYIGDTWRITAPLEVTLGLRWDYARLDQVPENNPAINQAFGRRTDIVPSAAALSPRIGFSLSTRSAADGRGATSSISGGLGLFAGQLPTDIFATAARQTGLTGSEQTLTCVGPATPIPDWRRYLGDPGSVPSACREGDPAVPDILSSRAPTITLIDPNQKLPASLRAEIGYSMRFPTGSTSSIRYTYGRGLGLWGYYDVNLDERRTFSLSAEGRPFFGDPSAIVAGRGVTTIAGSRIHQEFAGVYDVRADRESSTHQITSQFGGRLPYGFWMNTNYTMTFSRDQASGNFAAATTSANPNHVEWARSSQDRRHNLNLTFAKSVTPEIELTAVARLASGQPFTPMVASDINGDGAANDRAFIFDPSAVADTSIANGMARLLDAVPDRVADCLRSQRGQIAQRNSCRAPWMHSVNLRASWRPNLPKLDRRLSVSVDASNLLTGLDELFHGVNDMKGWGSPPRTENRLLEARGFDTSTRNFVYEVNEGFGLSRRGEAAIQNPFSLRLNVRIALGGQSPTAGRPFGAVASRAEPGGREGGRGRSAADFTTRRDGVVTELMLLIRVAGPGAANHDSLAAHVFPNPLAAIVRLGASLQLTAEQSSTLKALSDSLDAQSEPKKQAFKSVMGNVDLSAFAGGGRLQAAQVDMPAILQRLQMEVGPLFEAAKLRVADAMQTVQRTLTPAQLLLLPAASREAIQSNGRRPFNALGMIDRMLVNPLPVLLEFKDSVGLTLQQVAQIQKLSTGLDAKLTRQRDELGKRFDGVSTDAAPQVFQELNPQVQSVRREIQTVLNEVEKLLTSEQWLGIPEPVRNPLRNSDRSRRER